MKFFASIFVPLIFLSAAYFLIGPLFIKPLIQTVYPYNNPNKLSNAKDYYSIIQSIYTIFIAIFGLTLGYFYYENKKSIDKRNETNNRKMIFTERLLEIINQYDYHILNVLNETFKNESELKLRQTEIEAKWDIIEEMIEPNLNMISLSREEFSTFLELNSFVEMNDLIMQRKFNEVDDINDFQVIKENYLELVKEVRFICYQKII